MVVELLQNVAVLIALTVGLQMLTRHLTHRTATFNLAAGLFYGVAGLIGMMTPLRYAPGVIYDGRSIVLSLAGLFGGPVAAAVAAVMCGTYRLLLGGPGALPGVLVIVEAAALGVLLHFLRRKDERWLGILRLWVFGLVVHVIMLALQLLIQDGRGWQVIRNIGPAVLMFYPIGFVLVARVFMQVERSNAAETELRDTQARQRALIACSPIALYSTDPDGRVLSWNESAERLFGWSESEIVGRPLPIIPPGPRDEFLALRRRVLQGETFIGLERVRRRRDGTLCDVRVAVAPLRDSSGKVIGLFSGVEDITARKETEARLRENEERFRALVEGAPDAIFVQRDGKFAYLNAMALAQFGAASVDQVLGTAVLDRFHPSQREAVAKRIRQLNEDKRSVPPLEETILRLDGSEVTVEVSAVPVVFEGRDGAIVFSRDIAVRKDLEQRLFQAQKMEAVGRLAGGIAHDFNNMLQTILGYSDIVLDDMGPGDAHHDDLVQIRKAAARSADLTRQLLGFARKQIIQPQLLDLNDSVHDLLRMLVRMIGEDIELRWLPGEGEYPVLLDPSQVAQLLANLVVNARDAIPGVGCITIETSHAVFDEDYCSEHAGALPGRYELLSVSDTGSGMDKETIAKAFEPFFTTKERNKGTGLGLATVFGIVKQNDGFINLYSEPGQGTTVRIYLRSAQGLEEAAPQQPMPREILTGTETILLVEDEPALLELGRNILGKLGYRVVATQDPTEALAMVRDRGLEIDLLLTDVIMPQLSGRDLCAELQRHVPGLRCLYMSGYTDNVIAHLGVLEEGIHFLQKPFSSQELAGKLREIFGGTA
jgi:PAS domain S-box-containing protein